MSSVKTNTDVNSDSDSEEDLGLFTQISNVQDSLQLSNFEKIRFISKIAKTCRVRVETLLMILLLFVSCTMIVYLGGSFLFNMVVYLYPAYKAFKNLEKRDRKLIRLTVMYWIIVGFIKFLSPALQFIPYWNFIFLLLSIFMQAYPKFTKLLYLKVVRRVLRRNRKRIDTFINDLAADE